MSARKRLILLTVLAILCGIALRWHPPHSNAGKTRLIWATDNNPVRAAQLRGFLLENPDIEVTIDYNNTGPDNIIRQCSAGVGPDVFDLGGFEQGTYVRSEMILDVTKAANEMQFSVVKEGWPRAVDLGLYKGRQYGYYCNIGTRILIYNKNVFDDFGVPYPKELMTWDEFLNMAVKVTAPPRNPVDGKGIYALVEGTYLIYFDSVGGEFFTEEGLPDLKSDKLRAAFQWHKDMLYKYRLMPARSVMRPAASNLGWGTGYANEFAEGNFAMIVTGDWRLIEFTQFYEKQLQEIEKSKINGRKPPRPLRLGAVMIPHVAGMPPAYTISSRMAAINPYSSHPKEALKLLQYFAGPVYSEEVNRAMDWLPGNPEYSHLGVEEKYPDLSRVQMHEVTTKSMEFAYVRRESAFITRAEASRAVGNQIIRMSNDPNVTVEELLTAADQEVQDIIRRNIDRDPELKRTYEDAVMRHGTQ